jgi:site-specific DNA-cytosine methylase
LDDPQRVGNFEMYDFPNEPLAQSLNRERARDTLTYAPAVFRKAGRAQSAEHYETWVDDGLANTLNSFDTGDVRTTHAVLGGEPADENDLPLGLDSNRYRCCGNGVVAPVAEWIGRRILAVDAKHYEAGA